MDKIEYRAVITFFVKEGLTPNEIRTTTTTTTTTSSSSSSSSSRLFTSPFQISTAIPL
jgi:hypothetical protein